MEKVRLGILGFGNMGTNHTKNLLAGKCPEIELTAICDYKPERIEAAKELIGNALKVTYFAEAEEMFTSGLCDAILVAVPHYDHPKFSMRAMELGLHVMCEKPAGVYTKQVLEMNEFSKKCNVKFGLMMNQRTNCIYRKMREIIQSGEMGAIRRTNWIITNWYRPQAYYDSGDWRATWSGEGGGVLLNQCPHNLDLWQWICGMPIKVNAKLHFGKWHDIEVEDDVTAYVEYANGATGCFITSTADTPGTNRFEVTLEKGKIIAEGKSLKMWKSTTDMTEPEFSATNQKPFGHMDFEEIEVETDGENLQHSGVLNAFAGAILRDEPMVANGVEGINGLTISNAMHLSAWTGKDIDLENFDHELFYEELMKRVATSRRKVTSGNVESADLSDTYNS